jgi:hypothetical protein
MITIDKDTAAKLDKFAGLHARIERLFATGNEVGACDLITPEYHQLRDDLVEEFMPLVARLVEAGLIQVSIDGDGEYFTGSVAGNATIVFPNGNMVLHAKAIKTFMKRPLIKD